MPKGFLNCWSGGVVGDILFENFIIRVHLSPLRVEFMMHDVF